MSKRINISLTDSMYEIYEKESAKIGGKPIDLINKAVKESVDIQKINASLELQIKKAEIDKHELKNEIKELKDQVINLHKTVIESIRMNADYLAYSKASIRSLLMNLMKSKTTEESQKIMDDILNESIIDSKKSFDKTLGKF
jgi:hypothetical protein